MSRARNGGPAFPLSTSGYGTDPVNGMTLRDYFAAKAMQAILTSPNCPPQASDEAIAAQSYAAADAMLAERAKGGGA